MLWVTLRKMWMALFTMTAFLDIVETFNNTLASFSSWYTLCFEVESSIHTLKKAPSEAHHRVLFCYYYCGKVLQDLEKNGDIHWRIGFVDWRKIMQTISEQTIKENLQKLSRCALKNWLWAYSSFHEEKKTSTILNTKARRCPTGPILRIQVCRYCSRPPTILEGKYCRRVQEFLSIA